MLPRARCLLWRLIPLLTNNVFQLFGNRRYWQPNWLLRFKCRCEPASFWRLSGVGRRDICPMISVNGFGEFFGKRTLIRLRLVPVDSRGALRARRGGQFGEDRAPRHPGGRHGGERALRLGPAADPARGPPPGPLRLREGGDRRNPLETGSSGRSRQNGARSRPAPPTTSTQCAPPSWKRSSSATTATPAESRGTAILEGLGLSTTIHGDARSDVLRLRVLFAQVLVGAPDPPLPR